VVTELLSKSLQFEPEDTSLSVTESPTTDYLVLSKGEPTLEAIATQGNEPARIPTQGSAPAKLPVQGSASAKLPVQGSGPAKIVHKMKPVAVTARVRRKNKGITTTLL